MIAHVNGTLLVKTTERVVVDVGGVGYELMIPLSTYTALPAAGDRVSLHVHTHLRDSAIELFGFASDRERDVFRLLISISGIGPRLARNILSGIEVDDLLSSITRADRRKLSAIPGVGKKATERLILELREKAGALASVAEEPPVDGVMDDLVSALVNLGYRPAQAEEAARKARISLSEGADFSILLKEALRTVAAR